ncbi:MAG: hypothetical protein KJ709_02315 [Nanoarchaeota archaeon]|nr:hypothetical protein [Nanoarchaeota archaeon]
MGLFSRLTFWKKDDDFDFGKEAPPLGLDSKRDPLGMPSDPAPPFPEPAPPRMEPPDSGFSPQGPPGFQSQGYPSAPMQPAPINQDYIVSKEIEVVSSKLDGMRAQLDSINMRLANLERIMDNDMKKRW